jgi:glycosyltransferase involved in cell wall biosynthesis
MKVLTVTNMYPYAGDSAYGSFISEHVAALIEKGVDVDVLFLNPRLGKSRYLTGLPTLARAIRSRYDVLHAQHSYCAVQVAALRRVLRVRTPLLFTLHEGEAHSASPAGRDRALTKRLAYWKRLKRLAMEASDHVVTVDERLVAALAYQGPYSVIAPAIDTERFRPMDAAECRARLRLPVEQQLVLFPASPDRPEKGADLLEAALARMHRRRPHVVLGGRIEPTEMPLYMNAADVVVQTSHFEASPMIVKEALACDTPVVSTDVGDVTSLFGAAPACFVTSRDPQRVAWALERALAWTGPVGGRELVLAQGLSPASVAERYLQVFSEMSSTGRQHNGF